MNKKISLSFDKLSKFFEKHKYSIAGMFKIKDSITLIQVKTPKYKKTFFISVPMRYSLAISKSDTLAHKNDDTKKSVQIHIVDNTENINTKYLDLFNSALAEYSSGKEANIDFVCLSSEYIILNLNNTYVFYKEGTIEDPPPSNPKEVAILNLESEFKDTKQKIHTKQGINFIKNKLKPNIELEFEEDDECIKDIMVESTHKVYLDKETIVDVDVAADVEDIISHKENIKAKKNEDIEDIEVLSNCLNNTISIDKLINNNIIVGMIFVCVSVNTLFKTISTLEDDIYKYYNTIDKLEISARANRVDTIIKKLEEYRREQFEKLKNIEIREIDIKDKISRLSSVLLACDKLDKSTNKIEDQKNLKSLVEKSYKTLDELNLELLTLRDEAFDILEQCEKKL